MASVLPQSAPSEDLSPKASHGPPTVRVVAAHPERADELRNRLAALPVECISAEAFAADPSLGNLSLVVLEGMEAVAWSAMGPDSYLVALSSSSPAVYEGYPVLPAYVPGALEAWVHLLVSHSLRAKPSVHSDRLVAVGTLAAGFAHEVNNPAQALTFDLSTVQESLRWLERGTEEIITVGPDNISDAYIGELRGKYAETHELLQECFDGLGRITSIVRDLKGFARVQPEQAHRIHPNEIVNQACALVHNQIRHRARLIKELSANGNISGDKNQLVQVLTNLLVNAAQAMTNQTSDACIVVRSEGDAERVTLSVIDNGPGIPEDIRRRIFDPFFTTKMGEGTGIGLSISQDIAEQHGGQLILRSSGHQTTRFDLVLPRNNGLPVVEDTTPASGISTPSSAYRGRILIVDDEPALRRSLSRQIRRLHEVVAVGGAKAAYELLRMDTRFDVVLCDLMMPQMDGPQLYAKLQEELPTVAARMVFMSGGAFTERAQQFLERIKPRLLEKPTPPSVLEQTIQQVISRSAETVELAVQQSGPPTRNF